MKISLFEFLATRAREGRATSSFRIYAPRAARFRATRSACRSSTESAFFLAAISARSADIGAGLLAGAPELFFLAPPEPELLPRPRPAARAGAFLTDDPLVFEI